MDKLLFEKALKEFEKEFLKSVVDPTVEIYRVLKELEKEGFPYIKIR